MQPHWLQQPQKSQWAPWPQKHFFLKKLSDFDDFIPIGTKVTNTGPFGGIESSKIQIFTDTSQSFCQRLLRPANVTFLENELIKLKCPNLLNVLLPFFKFGSQLQLAIWDFKVCHIEFEHPVHTYISIKPIFLPNPLENRQGSGKVKEQNNPVYMHVYVFSKFN